MTIDFHKLRLYGVYRQDEDNNLMLRVKIPAGLLSSEQAGVICAISEEFSNAVLHLSTRGSIEFHWLRHAQLEEIFARLAAVGLTTRGACGGAVRGISCSTTFAPGYPAGQRLAQRLNRHFAGNAEFEGLPKKFKIGIDAGYRGARHLIQDIGLVLSDAESASARFDVWCAGGLGREPQAAFLLERKVAEAELIPLIEAVVVVYRTHTPPPKRLKFLLNSIGEEEFRRLLAEERVRHKAPTTGAVDDFSVTARKSRFIEVVVFAGEVTSARLRQLAEIAAGTANGQLAVTSDQNLALSTTSAHQEKAVLDALARAGIVRSAPGTPDRFRICPGNHECRMGLCATRDVAQKVSAAMSETARQKSWAISGCRNSCSQPQLADYGIRTSAQSKAEDGSRQPRFDLLARSGEALAEALGEELTLDELCRHVSRLP
jgi:sulfite reductase beta subunit-like hemoprotein